MADQLVFYTNPMSRGRIVRWMLEEVGCPYETKVLEYGQFMKAPEYLAINPMGKVPAIRHGETVVTECAAICAYLADVFADAGLAPPLDARGAYYRWLFFAAGPLETAVFNRSLEITVPAEKGATIGYGNYETTISTLSQAVESGGYIAADYFTAADVYIGSHIGWSMQFGTIEKTPVFESYWQRVSSRDAHHRAVEIDDALLADQTASTPDQGT